MADKPKQAAPAKKKSGSPLYKVEGDRVQRTRKFCPKCGEGTFLAAHKDRQTCGKCNYTEFLTK